MIFGQPCIAEVSQGKPAGLQEPRKAGEHGRESCRQRKQDALVGIFVSSWGVCYMKLSVRFLFLNITLREPPLFFLASTSNSEPGHHRDLRSLHVASVSIGVCHPLECCKGFPRAGQIFLLPCSLLRTPFFSKAAEQCMALPGFTRPLLLWAAPGNTTLAWLEEKKGGRRGFNGQRCC